MDDLNDYSESSQEEQEAPSEIKRPPPPIELLRDENAKRLRACPILLPKVLPVQLREDKFLVHLYLPIVHQHVDAYVKRLMGQARLRLTGGKIKAAFTPLTDFHVSIARAVAIRESQIRDLVAGLNRALRNRPRVSLTLRPKVEAFLSGNNRRLFVAAPIAPGEGKEEVEDLIKRVDKAYHKRELPVFFEDPRPHVSFAYTEIVEVQSRFCEVEAIPDSADEGSIQVVVNNVECVIGKSKYYFPLQ